MAQRLDFHALHIAQQPKTTKPKIKTIDSSFDYLSLADCLSPEQNRVRLNLRKLVDTEITPKICKFVQTATFPHFVLPLLRQNSILEHFSQQSKQKGSSQILKGILIAELARGDPALATFLINTVLFIDVLKQIGNKTQQQALIPKLLTFQRTASCGLLENLYQGLRTTKKQRSFILEGQARITVPDNQSIGFLWTESGESKLKGLIYQKNKWPQVKVKTENNRFGMRILSQQTLQFQKLIVLQQQDLFKTLDLKTSMIPINLRLWICWMTAGICIGVYDNTIKYASQRIQFNRPISGFQLIQEKLVRLMATTQAIILTCVAMSKLRQSGKLSYVKAGLAKGWICERARQVSRLGRQIYGGNGILHQNYSMRALADLEAIYSYGGTNESGLILAGKQLLSMQ